MCFADVAASTVPHLELFMSLVGSVTCVALTMLFPALSNLAYRTRQRKGDGDGDSAPALGTFLDAVTILTAVVGSVTGVYSNSTAIYAAFAANRGNG